ncbi:MAG: hypothetical protein CVU18_04555 [Betaproteobacteria bacterium HGW-Betaproteobacteria-12]|nr:MAG: hypothetical protein CVU18_04555 [Betaproteobacteria bacterium HGW-Betaproteobacteria-12]
MIQGEKVSGLSSQESMQPMASIALVLLVNTQMLYHGMDQKLVGMLMAFPSGVLQDGQFSQSAS